MGLWACSGEPDYPATPEDETQALLDQSHERTSSTRKQIVSDDQRPIFEEGPNWVCLGGGTYDYIVFDNKGNELFRNKGTPEFTVIEDLLRVDVSGGSGMRDTQFFDVEHGVYSPSYRNMLAFEHGLVAYIDYSPDDWLEEVFSLVVHDVFDPERDRIVFRRALVVDSVNGVGFENIVFVNKKQLFIEYYNSKDELVEETLTLR